MTNETKEIQDRPMKKNYICYNNWKIPVEYLDKMTNKELEQVHIRLQEKITKILSDRNRFKNENTLPENDPKFWEKMNAYRFALTKTQTQLHLVKTKLKEKNKEKNNKKDKFYYIFFRTAQTQLDSETFKKLTEQTINTLEITGIKYEIPDFKNENITKG